MTITEAQQARIDVPSDIQASDPSASSPSTLRVRRDDETPLDTRLPKAIEAARGWLWNQQDAAGFWCSHLEGDATCECYFIMLEAFLGRRASERSLELASLIRKSALASGGWSQYPGGPAEISVSTLSYFSLKLCGEPADAPHMVRAREAIRKLGGAERSNTYTLYHLAFFGQYSWADCPAIPPEMVYLPQRGLFSVYDMSSWSRTIFVPLAIIYAHKPVISVPESCGVSELFTQRRPSFLRSLRLQSLSTTNAWKALFLGLDRALKVYEKLPLTSLLRRAAVARAARWMTQRFGHTDGLSAILPAMANSIIALKLLGYADDHPTVREQLAYLDDLLYRDDQGALHMQPCLPPVWDTVLSAQALIQSGVQPDHEGLGRAATWLMSKQSRLPGDWRGRNRAEPGGWYFEFRNEFYPDVDDTCMALMVLKHARANTSEAAQSEAIHRGLHWMLGMQNRDGGWAAFDRDNDKYFLTQVPFADHNAMIDPSTADITGRVLECLGHFAGYGPKQPAVKRAVRFLVREQEADGAWYGRWGVNYLYGTGQALKGLAAVGFDMQSPPIRRAVKFLLDHQNGDGGWGENIASYDFPEQRAQGATTPSQTAWALLGLIASGEAEHPAVRRGIQHLVDTQDQKGSWEQPQWTGTGFPRVFYLNYPMYKHYFPLMALSQYALHRTASARK